MYDDEFAKIYQNSKLKLYSYVLYKVKSEALAEDIVSDAFLKFYKEIQTNKKVLSYALAWLYRVVGNLIIDQHRSSYYRQTSTESEEIERSHAGSDSEDSEKEVFVAEYEDFLQNLAQDEQQKQVLEAMKELKPEEQEIIELRLFQELPFKELAVILESTEAAMKMRYSRAIEKLKVKCTAYAT